MAGNYPIDILPDPSANGYSFSVIPICDRVRMDSGRYRQTRRATKQFHRVNLSWDLNDEQLYLWKGWYNAVTNNGGDSFQINLAFGGGLKGNLAQFEGSGYTATMTDLFEWNVSASLILEDIDEIDNSSDLSDKLTEIGGSLPNWRQNFSFEVESQNISSELEGGRIYRRNRNNRNVHVASMEWLLTDAELEYFKGWHRLTLEYGCKPFATDITLGNGFQSNTARFVNGAFSAQFVPGANNWIVTADFEFDSVAGINTFSEYLTATVG